MATENEAMVLTFINELYGIPADFLCPDTDVLKFQGGNGSGYSIELSVNLSDDAKKEYREMSDEEK